MNEEEFLNQYMGDSGIYEQSRAFGRRKAETDTVKEYLESTGSFDPDLFHPSMIDEYIPIRNKVFTSKYGEGFPEMYDKYKPVGEGAFGAVFQNPDDPSRVFKVQRQPGYQ